MKNIKLKITLIALLACGMVTVVKLWEKQMLPKAKLVAVVTYGEFALPQDLKDTLTPKSEAYFLRQVGGYWKIHLRNVGNKTATAIHMPLPFLLYYAIQRSNKSVYYFKSDTLAEIDRLEPAEQVTILAWTGHSLNRWDMDHLKITHSEGFAEIQPDVPLGPFWYWLSKFWWVLLLIVGFVSFVLREIWREEFRCSPKSSPSNQIL